MTTTLKDGEISPASVERKVSSSSAWIIDPENPHNWSTRRKWAIVLATGFVSFAVGANSTSIATPGKQITDQFHVSDDNFPNSFWPITAWTMAAAIGPTIGMPLLENFGTRKGFLITYVIFTLFVIPQAVAQNFATLIVTRVFAGFFGGTLQNGMEAFCADMFATEKERDVPIALFVLVYAAGVTLGPAWSSIFYHVSWRWVFYSELIIYVALFPILWLVIKETRAPIIVANKVARQAHQDPPSDSDCKEECPYEDSDLDVPVRPALSTLFYDAIVRPPILLFTEPVILCMSLWSAFCFCIVFVSIQSIESVYGELYNFNAASLGLIQISTFIGEVLGFIACFWQNSYYQNSAHRNKETPGVPIPEARLVFAIPTSFLALAGGLFWYGWTSYPHLHWALPSAGFVLIGFAVVVVVAGVVNYTTDSYTKYAGSAVSAIAMCENLLGAWVPLSTRRMYSVLGFQWASSLLGFVAIALSFAPLVLLFKGRKIREKSTYMSSH